MTAPGKNLEFEALPAFRRRCAPVAGLEKAVIAAIQNRPQGSGKVARGIWKLELSFKGTLFTAFYGRRPQSHQIGLVAIFDKTAESDFIFEKERELMERYPL